MYRDYKTTFRAAILAVRPPAPLASVHASPTLFPGAPNSLGRAIFQERLMIGSIRLGAIAPVSFCEDPIDLTTRLQPGRSVRNVFGRTMFRGTRQDLELAHKYMRAIAAWTACFRQAGAKEVGGFTPEQFLSFVRDHALEISQYIGTGQQAK
jgi:hypothetical protein